MYTSVTPSAPTAEAALVSLIAILANSVVLTEGKILAPFNATSLTILSVNEPIVA